jgi:hypothetical protein
MRTADCLASFLGLCGQIGHGLWLEDVAKRFDFAKIDKALANPPGE